MPKRFLGEKCMVRLRYRECEMKRAQLTLPQVALLRNPVQSYAWGSKSALAELQGRVPTGEPEAELWVGAHPLAPSELQIGARWQQLDALIAENPAAWLGSAVLARFGPRLPFLLKILAVAEPLSIQAHPDLEQARSGFARESRQGIALGDPRRSYRDDNHKPELVCALSEFRALKGFREPQDLLSRVRELGVADLESLVEPIGGAAPDLRQLVSDWLTLAPERCVSIVEQIRRAVTASGKASRATHWLLRIAERWPRDPGVLGPLFLQDVLLRPGEALFLPAGELHCYLEGVAVEVMANSDNVLRGGLTPKHVDLPELQRALRFEPGDASPLQAEPVDGLGSYRTPAAEFELSRLELAEGRSHEVGCGPAGSCQLLLCTAGHASLSAGKTSLEIASGAAAVILPEVRARLAGQGVFFVTRVPVAQGGPPQARLPRP